MIKKLRHAVSERNEQAIAFKKFSDALPRDAVAKWTSDVEAWEQDPTKPNPFFAEQESMYFIYLIMLSSLISDAQPCHSLKYAKS